MSRFGGITLLVLVLVSAASPAAAQWMWRDKTKDNQVTYSDRPPPAYVQDKDIVKRPNESRRVEAAPAAAAPADPSAPNAATAASAPSLVDPRLEAKRKEAEKQAAAQKKKDEDRVAAARADNCDRARKHLLGLDNGLRVSRTNAKGEPEVLDDKGREAEVRRTREVIASECK
ncbi:MAG: DUF4124 domain-containing protein [Pseudomonadota bacterium]